MQIGQVSGRHPLPQPAPELEAELVTKGEFSQLVGIIEFDFQRYGFSEPEHHLAAIRELIQIGLALREKSYVKYLNEPLVTNVPIEHPNFRQDVRLCGYGLGNYSVEDGSIRIKTLLLIGISFQVLDFGYDAISKYPDFKTGFSQITEDISKNFDDLENLLPKVGTKNEDGDTPIETPTVTIIASREEEIYEAVREKIETE